MKGARALGVLGVVVFGGFAIHQYLESGATVGMWLSVALASAFAIPAVRGK